MADINDVAGGPPSLKFETVGTTHKGTIKDFEHRQQTALGTGTPLTFPDGNPKMQWVITLQTEYRESPEDDGLRRLFMSPQMHRSAVEAAKEQGGLKRGGTLGVKFTGTNKLDATRTEKQYAAQYLAGPEPINGGAESTEAGAETAGVAADDIL